MTKEVPLDVMGCQVRVPRRPNSIFWQRTHVFSICVAGSKSDVRVHNTHPKNILEYPELSETTTNGSKDQVMNEHAVGGPASYLNV
jgi:hypothetical protein